MSHEIFNKSGHRRRKPSDNIVTKPAGEVVYSGKLIDYDTKSTSWMLNGKQLGSLSSLSKALGLNAETHDVGFYLESKGYRFNTPFQ